MARATFGSGIARISGLSLIAGVASAAALTGAAFFTVHAASCDDGSYIRHDDHVEFVGGCVDPTDVRAPSGETTSPAPVDDTNAPQK